MPTAVSSTGTTGNLTTSSYPPRFTNTLIQRRDASSVSTAVADEARTTKHVTRFSSPSVKPTVTCVVSTQSVPGAFDVAAYPIEALLTLAQVLPILGLYHRSVSTSSLASLLHPVFVADALWNFWLHYAFSVSIALRCPRTDRGFTAYSCPASVAFARTYCAKACPVARTI